MKLPALLTLGASLLAALLTISTQAAGVPLEPLFNGKDFTGWRAPQPNPFWTIADGVLTGTNDEKLKGNILFTEKTYGDFTLETEVRFSGKIDSGIMFHKPEIQMQIGISGSLKRDMTGSFYIGNYPEEGQAKKAAEFLKENEWNVFRLQAKGATYSVWINGEKLVEYTNAKYEAAGPIGLQVHPGVAMKVEFRNLRLRQD